MHSNIVNKMGDACHVQVLEVHQALESQRGQTPQHVPMEIPSPGVQAGISDELLHIIHGYIWSLSELVRKYFRRAYARK